MAIQHPNKKEQPLENRVLALEYFEEKTERHLGEMKQSVENMQGDVTDIKNAIIGNKMNGDSGIIFLLNSIKKKQDIDDEVITTHKVYFRQIAWFIGVISAIIIGLILKVFVK